MLRLMLCVIASGPLWVFVLAGCGGAGGGAGATDPGQRSALVISNVVPIASRSAWVEGTTTDGIVGDMPLTVAPTDGTVYFGATFDLGPALQGRSVQGLKLRLSVIGNVGQPWGALPYTIEVRSIGVNEIPTALDILSGSPEWSEPYEFTRPPNDLGMGGGWEFTNDFLRDEIQKRLDTPGADRILIRFGAKPLVSGTPDQWQVSGPFLSLSHS